MTPKISHSDSNYYSGGNLEVTAKALNEIVVPTLNSVHEKLKQKGLDDGDFSVQIEHKYIKHVATLRIKIKTGGTASLTFRRDVSKGGLQVKSDVTQPQNVTIKSPTKVICKTRSTSKTLHLEEANLTKEILEQTVSYFIDGVAKLKK